MQRGPPREAHAGVGGMLRDPCYQGRQRGPLGEAHTGVGKCEERAEVMNSFEKMRLCKLELPRDTLKVYCTQFLKGGAHKTGRQ